MPNVPAWKTEQPKITPRPTCPEGWQETYTPWDVTGSTQGSQRRAHVAHPCHPACAHLAANPDPRGAGGGRAEVTTHVLNRANPLSKELSPPGTAPAVGAGRAQALWAPPGFGWWMPGSSSTWRWHHSYGQPETLLVEPQPQALLCALHKVGIWELAFSCPCPQEARGEGR